MRKLIGFANQFYTLWEVGDRQIYSGSNAVGVNSSFVYLQNLSMTEEGAFKRFKELTNQEAIGVDYELKGITQNFKSVKIDPEFFDKGKYCYNRISDCVDVSYMEWYHNNLAFDERKKILSGILIKNGYTIEEGQAYIKVEPTEDEKALEAANKGLHYAAGDKVELNVKVYERFGFEGYFGYTTVITMIDQNNNLVKYVGGSPNDAFCVGFEGKIKCTIKHDKYRQETNLQRVKVL